jgi:AraC-like DNA-binding protein
MPFIKYQEITSTIFENNSNKIPFIKHNYVDQIKLIDNYFVNEKKFQIQELNLSIVAVSLNIPVRDLSYIINNYYELRFNDFVNKFRIEYIINKLTPSNLDIYTIDSLSKEAGFSSKSSFYRAFNKIHQINAY